MDKTKTVVPFVAYYVIRSFPQNNNGEYFGGPFNSYLQASSWLLDHEILFQGATYSIVECISSGKVL